MRITIVAAATLALGLPQVAAAAEPPCLTPREVSSLTTFALPSAINGTARTCAPSLPADAWLPRNAAQLAQRYAAARGAAWPDAKAAFIKMSTATNPEAAALFVSLPDDSLRQMADAALAGIISGKVKPASCPAIDRMVALLAPLPPENTAELIGVVLGLTAKAETPRIGKFALCKA